jgi:NadR type nicotinamide-nucleotide adenylyltransferase
MGVNNQTKKIIITGPESSGKTTLARQLAESLGAPWVPEYARHYFEAGPQTYQASDILRIAELQFLQQTARYQQGPDFLICDTGFLVLKIWLAVKFGQTNEWLDQQFLQDPVDLYLLCQPNIPWEDDPLRENPTDRDQLFELYLSTLKEQQQPYQIISESLADQRLLSAQQAVSCL